MELPDTLVASDDIVDEKDMSRTRHGITLLNIGSDFLHYLKRQPVGMLYMEADLYFTPDGRKYIPDLCFSFRENDILNEERDILIGTPDLIMEVISPTSLMEDTTKKYRDYQHFGVKEYWIIFPSLRQISIYFLDQGSYHLHRVIAESGQVQSRLLPDFQLDLETIF